MTPPSVYAKNLPISMEKIILKCTQKNADRRYQTIGDLLATCADRWYIRMRILL